MEIEINSNSLQAKGMSNSTLCLRVHPSDENRELFMMCRKKEYFCSMVHFHQYLRSCYTTRFQRTRRLICIILHIQEYSAAVSRDSSFIVRTSNLRDLPPTPPTVVAKVTDWAQIS